MSFVKPFALSSLFLSCSVFADSNLPSFARLFGEASGNGQCQVEIVDYKDSTFFVPSTVSTGVVSRDKFHLLLWGNGTGENPLKYRGVLESIASHCIFVAAANTGRAGNGRAVAESFDQALEAFPEKLQAQLQVCTSGHSQGGGGAFNAANLLEADCVISIQADTWFTTRIREPLSADTEVIALWSSSDRLAPAEPRNLQNVDRNSGILTSVETLGETHRTPLQERAGAIGTMFRMAALAQLSADPQISRRYRAAFWGPETTSTVTDSVPELSEVFRDPGAIENR